MISPESIEKTPCGVYIFTAIYSLFDSSSTIEKPFMLINLFPKIRFHDLHHTADSLMLNNGVDVLVASQRLGHAKSSITLNTYGHLMPSMQNKAANILDNLISNKQ